jgi:two-component system response regulator VicR
MEELRSNEQTPLTTGQIGRYCHVTHRAVLKWVESGKLKAYRTPGMHSRVKVEDFLEFLKQYNMPVPAEFKVQSIRKRILIVDDDRGIVHSLKRVLMMLNKYDIDVAFDGFEAGKKCSIFKPDFIILDIRMPHLDGYQVCANVRKDPNLKNVQILAISALNEPQDIKKIMNLGANDYLEKPFSNEVLLKKVELMMG